MKQLPLEREALLPRINGIRQNLARLERLAALPLDELYIGALLRDPGAGDCGGCERVEWASGVIHPSLNTADVCRILPRVSPTCTTGGWADPG